MTEKIKITKDLDIDYDDLMKEVDVGCPFTLRDVLRAAALSTHIQFDSMCKMLHCHYIGEYWKEANSQPFKDDGNIDYLELYWSCSKDHYRPNESVSYDSMWEFHGMGKEGVLPDDCPQEFTKNLPKDYRQPYAIELSPMYELADYPIKVKDKIILTNQDEEDYDKLDQEYDYRPSITLIELLYWIFWELSFMGDTSERDNLKESLSKDVAEIKQASKEGRLDEITTPWEDVKKELKKEE